MHLVDAMKGVVPLVVMGLMLREQALRRRIAVDARQVGYARAAEQLKCQARDHFPYVLRVCMKLLRAGPSPSVHPDPRPPNGEVVRGSRT